MQTFLKRSLFLFFGKMNKSHNHLSLRDLCAHAGSRGRDVLLRVSRGGPVPVELGHVARAAGAQEGVLARLERLVARAALRSVQELRGRPRAELLLATARGNTPFAAIWGVSLDVDREWV